MASHRDLSIRIQLPFFHRWRAQGLGTASGKFDGSGDYLTIPASADFNLGTTEDFSIEAWIRLGSTAVHFPIVSMGDDINFTGAGEYIFLYNASVGLRLFSNAGSVVAQGSTTGWTAGTWYHVACVRRSGVITLYRNGEELASASSSIQIGGSTLPQSIGGNLNEPSSANGYIDSLRITKGYARYTAAFTPPTASFPVGKDESVDPFWSSTVLAMHMDNFTDATGRHVITNVGSATNNTTTKKFGTASGLFNGINQYLTTPNSTDYDFGTADFTIELWMKTAQTAITVLLSRWPGTPDNGSWVLHLNVFSGKLSIHANGSGSALDREPRVRSHAVLQRQYR